MPAHIVQSTTPTVPTNGTVANTDIITEHGIATPPSSPRIPVIAPGTNVGLVLLPNASPAHSFFDQAVANVGLWGNGVNYPKPQAPRPRTVPLPGPCGCDSELCCTDTAQRHFVMGNGQNLVSAGNMLGLSFIPQPSSGPQQEGGC